MNKKQKKIIVVGGGLAGLSAAMRLAERGCFVNLVSLTKVRRSHSVCAQGGINAALNLKGEEDSPIIHAYDTIKGGDFLANQPPIVEMCMAGPAIVQMLSRLGCPFNRNANGDLDVRRFGGTLYSRTVFCGATTGQQLMYTLDEQVRKWESKGFVQKFENHEFMRLVLDDNQQTRGIILMNLWNNDLSVLEADAVIFATGGLGLIFKKSTNSTFCTGAANGRLYKQGMKYANGEFIQIHPTAIPGLDKLRLISESVRGEGGRVWTPGDGSKTISTSDGRTIQCGKTGEPWYFLEEMFPGYGNLVARDVGAREILRICELGLGVDGKNQVYLDVRHLKQENLNKLKAVLEIYQKFTGDDPRNTPMRIFPAVHYSMGGAWVDWPAADDQDRYKRYRQMTNISGCFNCGESDYQYHGANRLGANALLSCIYGGLVSGEEASRYAENVIYNDVHSIFERDMKLEERCKANLLSKNGSENIYQLHEELADFMVKNVTVKRNNRDLSETINKIMELKERYNNISLDDKSCTLNQTYQFANQFDAMLELALVITKCALLRDEFRGAHFKPEFPNRDDKNWLKTTIATYSSSGPIISYEPVDMRHINPEERDYTVAKKTKPDLKNIPAKVEPII